MHLLISLIMNNFNRIKIIITDITESIHGHSATNNDIWDGDQECLQFKKINKCG